MNQAIKKLLRDYLRLIFIFSLPWYFEFLTGVRFEEVFYDAYGFLLFFYLIIFTLFVLNWSIKLVKVFGKDSIYSIFYTVPLTFIFFPYLALVSNVSEWFYLLSPSAIRNISDFAFYAKKSGLNYLIILNVIMFTLYYKLRD